MYASRVPLYDLLCALPCRAPASAPNRSGAGPHQLRDPLGMLPEAPALHFLGLQKQDEMGSRQARTPPAASNPAERQRGDAAERPRDALSSPRPWGSSRMVVDERGTQHLPARKAPACSVAAGEEAATSHPRQLQSCPLTHPAARAVLQGDERVLDALREPGLSLMLIGF